MRNTFYRDQTRIYFSFELYPITGNLGSGDGFYLYLPDTYDPVGNPLLTGPGVRGFEIKFQNTDVRVTPVNNFSPITASRTFGYHPLIIGAPQRIEVELNFATNIMSVQLDGVRYVFSASLVSPGVINGCGAIGLAANQLTSITDITVMAQYL